MNELLLNLNFRPLLSALPYLDPGSGSAIFQLVIAGLVGTGFIIRLFWKRIVGIFNRGETEEEELDIDEQ